MPFPRSIFGPKPSDKPQISQIQPPQGNDKQRAKKNRRRNAKLTKRRQKALSFFELQEEIDGKGEAAYERRELNETKRLLKVLRQYTHWYLARAEEIDGMTKHRIYQASSQAKRLEALSSMSEEERAASMEWLQDYVSRLSAAKAAGLWGIETGEAW